LSAVVKGGNRDREEEDSLACLMRGVDAYGTRRLGPGQAATDDPGAP
jgi:hypothetical protein